MQGLHRPVVTVSGNPIRARPHGTQKLPHPITQIGRGPTTIMEISTNDKDKDNDNDNDNDKDKNNDKDRTWDPIAATPHHTDWQRPDHHNGIIARGKTNSAGTSLKGRRKMPGATTLYTIFGHNVLFCRASIVPYTQRSQELNRI